MYGELGGGAGRVCVFMVSGEIYMQPRANDIYANSNEAEPEGRSQINLSAKGNAQILINFEARKMRQQIKRQKKEQ